MLEHKINILQYNALNVLDAHHNDSDNYFDLRDASLIKEEIY